MKRILLIAGLAVVLAPTLAFAEGDAAAGKNVFKKCMACHDAAKEAKRVGPHLVGIVGRKAAAVEGFAYSDAMKAKGAEGLIWDEANLTAYFKAPKEFVPATKMAFAGLKDDADIANLIAFLKADPKPE
ncbi:MAG: c-type cytochrome [Rhizobiaceae bacterium]